jgi:ubiquinone/menaquinone biosynthesis C-methylase UbiE
MASHTDAWKDEELVRSYLQGIRGALPLVHEQFDVLLRVVAAGGIEPATFADLGCGGGTLAGVLLERYPEARAVLVDFSEPMLREAREALRSHAKRCTFISADLSSYEWVRDAKAVAPFDVIVSGFAIHHLTDERKRALYGEAFDLLSPGGLFVNTEHVSSASPWLTEVFDNRLIDSYEAFHRANGAPKSREEIAAEYVHRPDREANILASVEDQCDWLRDIGYQDVDCYFKLYELAIFGGRKPPA